jgi:hypothetical protein
MPTRKIIVYNCVSCPCGDESRCTYSMNIMDYITDEINRESAFLTDYTPDRTEMINFSKGYIRALVVLREHIKNGEITF